MESYTDKTAEVEIVHLWDGRSEATGEVARLRVSYPEFESLEYSEEILSSWRVQLAVREHLQEFVNRRLGEFSISAQDVEVRPGSLTIGVILAAAVVFVKDYPKIREGVLQLVKDLRAAAERISATVRGAASEEKAEQEREREREGKKKTQVQRSSGSG